VKGSEEVDEEEGDFHDDGVFDVDAAGAIAGESNVPNKNCNDYYI
jgi:hypothetical protein